MSRCDRAVRHLGFPLTAAALLGFGGPAGAVAVPEGLALPSAPGAAHAAYTDATGALFFATRAGDAWSAEAVCPGIVADALVGCAGTGDAAVVAFVAADADGLQLARRTGASWRTETVDPTPVLPGAIAVAEAPDGTVWVAVSDRVSGAVRAYHHERAGWQRHELASAGECITRLAVDAAGPAVVAWIDPAQPSLVAVRTGAAGPQFDHVDLPLHVARGDLRFAAPDVIQVLGGPGATGPEVTHEVRLHFDATPASLRLLLSGPAPNPRTRPGAAAFTFALDRGAVVTLAVFDARGRRVAERAPQRFAVAGRHRIEWDPGALAPGTYFVRLQRDDGSSASTKWRILR